MMRSKKDTPEQQQKNHSKRTANRAISVLRFSLHPVFLSGIFLLSIYYSQTNKKGILEIHAMSRAKEWDNVIQKVEELRRRGLDWQINLFEVNRALYHTGKMGERFFAFPQSSKLLFFYDINTSNYIMFDKKRELNYDIGDINSAEDWAYETLETQGPCPYILYELAKIHLIKNQPDLAKVFLMKLKKDLIWKNKASLLLDKLENDPSMENDPEISAKRKQVATEDHAVDDDTIIGYLERLVKNNPSNQMAFEYLMSMYLLTHQREKILKNIDRLKDFGYDHLPRHYAEAVIIYMAKLQKAVFPEEWQIDPKLIQQYKEIINTMKAMNMNKKAALPVLAPIIGDSYFFYSLYNISGLKR